MAENRGAIVVGGGVSFVILRTFWSVRRINLVSRIRQNPCRRRRPAGAKKTKKRIERESESMVVYNHEQKVT